MYYKGNTIGLNYDAATGTWSFDNTPNDFIDTEAFSSQDPKFDYVPPEDTTPDEPDDDPCPEGYIYDSTLKQCVIDPNYQNPFSEQQNQGGGNDAPAVRIAGTNRTTTDGNFIASDAEYDAMSPGDLIENYKQRGFIRKNDKGELVVDLTRVKRKGGIMDALLGRIGQPQVESDATLNKIIGYLMEKGIADQSTINTPGPAGQTTMNTEIVIPTIAKFEADYYGLDTPDVIVPGFGDSIFGFKQDVQQFDDYMSQKLAAFSTVANNAISNYTENNYLKESGINDIEKEKARKAKFEADIAKAKAEREMQQNIRDAEEAQAKKDSQQQEFDNLSNLKQGESYTDDSGDTYTKTTTDNRSGSSGQGFSFTPSKTNTNTKTYENKRRGGYTGSTAGRGGTASAKTPKPSRAQKQTTVSRSGPVGRFKG